MYSFTLTKPRTANYTPAGLIHEYARAALIPFLSTWQGSGLIINGRFWFYDHWSIINNRDGTETVTVYLEED